MDNIFFILTGPSGSGKTTFSTWLFNKHSDFCEHNITYTTRKPRPEESQARFFRFLSPCEFDRLHREGEFFCSVEFCGNKYAYRKEDFLIKNNDFIIDSIMKPEDLKKLGNNVVLIYLTTSTNQELYQRIMARNPQMEQSELLLRIKNFSDQLSVAPQCDYIIFTDSALNKKTIQDDLEYIYNQVKTAINTGGNIYPSSLDRFRVTELQIDKLPYDIVIT